MCLAWGGNCEEWSQVNLVPFHAQTLSYSESLGERGGMSKRFPADFEKKRQLRCWRERLLGGADELQLLAGMVSFQSMLHVTGLI